MKWIYNDGGRKQAGFKGNASDCVCRAISIVSNMPYQQIYDEINCVALRERKDKGRSSARTGIRKQTSRNYIQSLGYQWHPTMGIGTGCKVHLKAEELPQGRLIVKCSKHLTAVIDGVIYDTFDPSRNGTRCVYGYYSKEV